MKRLILLIILLSPLWSTLIETNGRCILKMENRTTNCEFLLIIPVKIPAEDLMPILFNFNNLKLFSKQVDEMKLLSKSSGTNYEVEFKAKYLFNEMISSYNRLITPENKIQMSLLSFKQTLKFLPKLSGMTAELKAYETGGYTYLSFHQFITLDTEFQWVHFEVVKRKLRGYAADLDAFLRLQEKNFNIQK